MKCSIVFIAATLIATVSLAYSDYDHEEVRTEYCPPLMIANESKCIEYKCNKNVTSIVAKACPLSICPPGTQIGYKAEESDKPYPDCCPYPICYDDSKQTE